MTDLLVDWRRALGLIGGAFLLWIAWQTARAVPTEAATTTGERRGLPGAYLSTLGLTLTNPMTILSFAALFVGLGVTADDLAGASVLTLGVFLGSAAWWVILVTLVGAFRSRLTPTWLRRINVASGARVTRKELLEEAWKRIRKSPRDYYPHVYGENEVGGTSVLFLAPHEVASLGYKAALGNEPLPKLTWQVLSKLPGIGVVSGAALMAIWWITRRRDEVALAEGRHAGNGRARGHEGRN